MLTPLFTTLACPSLLTNRPPVLLLLVPNPVAASVRRFFDQIYNLLNHVLCSVPAGLLLAPDGKEKDTLAMQLVPI